ncbi:MAG: UDP-N-acetylmuramoyl-L-alanine--D-glutamate ligase [Termitinemataceae bacterium]|nr:MAG: UDP-N-acetylmuramoyl-L-alanine--D-glutamate ligase [Termitinemataceae bacterium]
MTTETIDYSGIDALVMGLGINGGGLESAKFLAKHGAKLTVTDLRSAEILQASITALDEFVGSINAAPVRYVLGHHEIDDFKSADLVIKNPGVPPSSPFLQAAKTGAIETDISLFLKYNPARLSAVTGSKGKSFITSAIYYALNLVHTKKMKSKQLASSLDQSDFCSRAYIGGNITVSPLTFLEKLTANDDVVLELSSWQLGDIKNVALKPRVAVLSSIMKDHQDRYGNMESYVADKRIIYECQDETCATVAQNDEWGRSFLSQTKAKKYLYSNTDMSKNINGAYLKDGEGIASGQIGLLNGSCVVVPKITRVQGVHQKTNLLAASLCLLELGVPPDFIRECNAEFPGIEHRLELFFENGGIKFYNDTAATIPEAAACAIEALENAVLITGGTDKDLDFAPFIKAAHKAKKIILLEGSAQNKIIDGLRHKNIRYSGPFASLDAALNCALENAESRDSVVLSPGCASFGMFINEFDRGRKWKEAVRRKYSVALP